jgi:hypothetical protein
MFIKKRALAALVAIFFINSTNAQNNTSSYKNAIGVKVFDGAGITFKHFMDDKSALEFIGYFWRQGTRVTGLYELHFDIDNTPGLKWYIGPGAHLGFYNNKYGDGAFVGIDGVLGLDYKIKEAPLNLSLDWQPSFEFGTDRGFIGNWGGLGIRYTF